MFAQKQSQRSFQQDHTEGKEGERQSFPFLKKFSKHTLVWMDDVYAPWDFEASDVVIEHKNRFVDSDTYKTAMIKYLKVQRAEKEQRTSYFVFRYTNGIFYIKYKKSLFDTFHTDVKKIENRSDYTEKEEKRIYIPIPLLKCLVKFQEKPLFVD